MLYDVPIHLVKMSITLIVVLFVGVVSSLDSDIPREDTVPSRVKDSYQHAVELLSKHPLIDG